MKLRWPSSSWSADTVAAAQAVRTLTRCFADTRPVGARFDHANEGPPTVADVADDPIDTSDRYPPEIAYSRNRYIVLMA